MLAALVKKHHFGQADLAVYLTVSVCSLCRFVRSRRASFSSEILKQVTLRHWQDRYENVHKINPNKSYTDCPETEHIADSTDRHIDTDNKIDRMIREDKC